MNCSHALRLSCQHSLDFPPAMGDGCQRRWMANRGIISELCVQLYPCGWRSCVHTFLPCINIGVISHTHCGQSLLGGGKWCHTRSLQCRFFTVTGKRLGRLFTHTLQSECPVWFKAVYMAHFLHNEQQMLTKGISLLTSQTISGTSLCSFIIAFHLYLCGQILAVRLPAGRCSAHKCCCCHYFNSLAAFIHGLVSVWSPPCCRKSAWHWRPAHLLFTAGLGSRMRSYLQNEKHLES